MPDNNFVINGGSNQILPNAQEANQYFIGDSAILAAQQGRELSKLARLGQEIGREVAEESTKTVLYSHIVHEFDVYILSLVEEGKTIHDIMAELHESIVKPIMTIYQEHGWNRNTTHDTPLP